MRLGIAGGPGIGKSLLARTLVARLSVPLVPEGVREWLAEARAASADHLSRRDQERLQTAFVHWKLSQESGYSDFVSDRTVIDGFVIAQRRLGTSFVFGTRKALYDSCRAHAQAFYDLVIVPPARFSSEKDEARTSRPADRWAEHEAIIELLRSWKVPWTALEGAELSGWLAQVDARTLNLKERDE